MLAKIKIVFLRSVVHPDVQKHIDDCIVYLEIH